MKSFYSILYCSTRPNIGEQIGVALIVYTDRKVYFKISEEKLKAIREILPNNAYQLFKSTIVNFSEYVNQLTDGNIFEHSFINQKYFQYLNAYSTNLLKFSQPKELTVDADKFNIEQLFRLYIYEINEEKHNERSVDFVKKIKRKFNPKIQSHVNIDYKLDKNIIPHLAIPTNVWFVGKNEHKVIGDVIDCTKDENSLGNKLRSVIYVKEQLYREDDKSKIYVIHNLSAKNDSSTLELVQKEYESIHFLHESNFEFVVPKYLVEHNVQKISKE